MQQNELNEKIIKAAEKISNHIPVQYIPAALMLHMPDEMIKSLDSDNVVAIGDYKTVNKLQERLKNL